VKTAAHRSGLSESGIRKLVRENRVAHEWIGGSVFLTAVPTRRKRRQPASDSCREARMSHCTTFDACYGVRSPAWRNISLAHRSAWLRPLGVQAVAGLLTAANSLAATVTSAQAASGWPSPPSRCIDLMRKPHIWNTRGPPARIGPPAKPAALVLGQAWARHGAKPAPPYHRRRRLLPVRRAAPDGSSGGCLPAVNAGRDAAPGTTAYGRARPRGGCRARTCRHCWIMNT
jgi:hypothetical protein